MKTISLNGIWTLKGRSTTDPSLKSIEITDATVPGMAQLELSRLGIIPEDIYMGMNITETEKYEDWEWWYEREFDVPTEHERAYLVFRGVDCFAEYFLNGEKIGESANMFIPYEFDVANLLKVGKNTITVHLLAPKEVAHNEHFDLHCLANYGAFSYKGQEMLYARRAAHTYGWDIMPRAITCGLWRDVQLELRDKICFEQFFFDTRDPSCILFDYELSCKLADFKNVDIEVELTCRDSHYTARRNALPYKAGKVTIPLTKKPYLWWPYGYGEPNLYQATARIYSNGQLVHEMHTRMAFRTVELDRTDVTDGKNGKFRFLINGVEVMAKGSNWVPMDAFHNRDKARYARALELAKDIGCNILRCWGGNVYEDHEFFDFCEENGIMVWQDFAMACFNYPCDERMEKALLEEATAIVREYRHHPSIILWSGDNEIDACVRKKRNYLLPTSTNTLTRRILPHVVERNDIGRPYLASSPYISDEALIRGLPTAEHHLWGSRDYFKSYEYRSCPAHFISECGYHGCPDPESIKKFITPEKVWPYFDNEEWTLHSSDQDQNDSRVMLMHKQVLQLFGEVPDSLEDYAVASQISQAEAFKYLIERMRVARPLRSGIIWWNLLDGWPQMSDAIVDYYYKKKLAYDYVKRSQAAFAICADEIAKWKLRFYACNDTQNEQRGRMRIFDVDTNETLAERDFVASANTSTEVAALDIFYSEKRFLVIEWTIDGKTAYNHYLCGYPAFDLAKYREWLAKYRSLSGFCADMKI
ncbi:MAG: hypothetical protein IJW16_08155 [Clostridia bacterium]|nr:hypothetical protein [Clostridia bacterium]